MANVKRIRITMVHESDVRYRDDQAADILEIVRRQWAMNHGSGWTVTTEEVAAPAAGHGSTHAAD